jgi:hypothetical protein
MLATSGTFRLSAPGHGIRDKRYRRDIVYRFLLRLPTTLSERLKDAAKENGRSLNAEIVHRLKVSLEGWRQTS